MLASFAEFKFYQSFRVPVEEADELRFMIEYEDDMGKNVLINDAKLLDISMTGLGFSTQMRLPNEASMTMSLQFKKNHLDLTGSIVRAFSNGVGDDRIIYGVEIDPEVKINRFLELFILSFSQERLRDCLIDSTLKERYSDATDRFETFSLLLSLFRDIAFNGDKENFMNTTLEEVVQVMNALGANIYLINTETNELEAVASLHGDKEKMKFDYRSGIVGTVFTTGTLINIDKVNDNHKWKDVLGASADAEIKSVLCHPIHNREDKIIGVIEVINKRNTDRFTIEDEKVMKVLALVFSSIFHQFTPMSEKSQIRRFSTNTPRKLTLVGRSTNMASLRNTILKIKDLDAPALIYGEKGVGKKLYAKILHNEGKRGLHGYEIVHCENKDRTRINYDLWDPENCAFVKCQGGVVVLNEVCDLSLSEQERLLDTLVHDNRSYRIIATSSQDLGKMVDRKNFLPELYNYLNISYITIDPLRRRIDDIPYLVDFFLKIECKKQGQLMKEFSEKAIKRLKDYDWPGNVKELRTCVERAVLYYPKLHIISETVFENTASPLIDFAQSKRAFGDLPFVGDFRIPLKDRMCIIELEMITGEIKRNNGNKSKAAKEMGISREALRKKLMASQKILAQLQKEHHTKIDLDIADIDEVFEDNISSEEILPTNVTPIREVREETREGIREETRGETQEAEVNAQLNKEAS